MKMSKTLIFFIVLVAGAGLAIGLLTDFNLIKAIQNPTTLLDSIKALPQTILTHWQTLVGTLSGVIGTLLLVSRAYNQHKEQTQETVNNLQQQSSDVISQLTVEKQKIEQQFQETTKNYTDLSSNFVKVQDKVTDLEDINKQLTKQLADNQAYYKDVVNTLKAEKIELQRKA
jgi:hypothetical protein